MVKDEQDYFDEGYQKGKLEVEQIFKEKYEAKIKLLLNKVEANLVMPFEGVLTQETLHLVMIVR